MQGKSLYAMCSNNIKRECKMDMRTWTVDEVFVVQPMARKIDFDSATDFKGTMVDFINRGNLRIVLDLSNVDAVDSTGLGMIVSSLKSLGHDGCMTICGLSDSVRSVFTMTHMHKLFDIVPTLDEAIEKSKSRYMTSRLQTQPGTTVRSYE